MKVVYIAGPYRAATESQVFNNILTARDWAITCWGAGVAPICPHLNSMLMGGEVDDQVLLNGDHELLRRSDAIIMINHWTASRGAVLEHLLAQEIGKPIFDMNLPDNSGMEAFIAWAKE